MVMVTSKMETQKIKLAIVVLNWNGKKWLSKFLPTLINNSKGGVLFLVDNASSDDSVDFVRNRFSDINIIINDDNFGYAKGYNNALRQINADYFVLINSDIEVKEGWFDFIINLMDKDLDVAACQPKILDYNNKEMFEYAGASGGFIDIFGYPFCRGRILEDIEEDKGQYDNSTEIFWATGACLFVRSSHFWEIGGFDDDFFAHQEEIDLCWRLKNKGYKVMVEPKSVVYHVGGGTLQASSPLKTYLNFRNNLYMIFKNSPLSYLFFIIPVRLILDGVAAFTFLNKKKGIRHLFAVVKAHFIFYLTIPRLLIKRNKLKQKHSLIGKMDYSILVKNKLQGVKQFSNL